MTRHEIIEQVDVEEIILKHERERLTQLERYAAQPWYRRVFGFRPENLSAACQPAEDSGIEKEVLAENEKNLSETICREATDFLMARVRDHGPHIQRIGGIPPTYDCLMAYARYGPYIQRIVDGIPPTYIITYLDPESSCPKLQTTFWTPAP